MTQSIMDDIDTTMTGNAKIKVIGVGGAGGNAVQEMISSQLYGVQFVCANTDLQALGRTNAPIKVQLGEKLTKGLGAGANPAVGRDAAVESINSIRDAIGDADMVFVTAGMGGGTGTGAAPIIAQAAKEMNALTVGVVTKPFSFEGPKRQRMAEEGLEEFKKFVDCLIIIPNDRLLALAPKKTTFAVMLQQANEVLFNAVRGISDVILHEGMINLDFADVRTTMSETGMALMGTGRASGENRAREAAQQAIMSPLLEDVSLESAKSILYNITSSIDITMEEVSEIGYMIREAANDENINIIFGVVTDEKMGDELQVTVIATGIDEIAPKVEECVSTATVTTFPKAGSRNIVQDTRRVSRTQPQPEPEVDYEPQPVRVSRRPPEDVWYDERINRSTYGRRDPGMGKPRPRHMPGKDSSTYDEDDYEIPAFLRTQAD